jgi:hypothetical protein
LHTGDADAAKANDPGTKQWGNVDIVEAGRHGIGEVGTHLNVFGVTTVDGVAGEDGIIAEVFQLVMAVPATAVNSAHPRDADAGACGKFGSGSFDDLADDLVAGNQARTKRRQVSFDDVKVGAADSAGEHSKDDVAGLELRARHVLDLQKWRG